METKKSLERSEKIAAEKRKRHQAYTALDYFSPLGTYFDYFSPEAFTIVKNAKNLAHLTNKSITSEFLLLSYFYSQPAMEVFLKSAGVTGSITKSMKTFFPELINDIEKRKPTNFLKKFKERIFPSSKPKTLKKVLDSHEVSTIFEKAVDNARVRFKTPVITPEILFITLMESKHTKVGKIIEGCFNNELAWLDFRYNLVKSIHTQESSIRTTVMLSQHYFAYLLKTQVGDSQYNAMIKNAELESSVGDFRNYLISAVVEKDLFKHLLDEVHLSIKLTTTRGYSTE
jgi:hypothetical protein